MPLQAGQVLTLGYGSGGSLPLLIPFADGECFALLKVSFFVRPLDPLYDSESFRAPHLPQELKGPWATVTKLIKYHLSLTPEASARSLEPSEDYRIEYPATAPHVRTEYTIQTLPSNHLCQKPRAPRALVPHAQNKGIFMNQEPIVEKPPGFFRISWRWLLQTSAHIFGPGFSYGALALELYVAPYL